MIIDHPNPTRRRIAHWVGLVSGTQCTMFYGYRLSELILLSPDNSPLMCGVWFFLVMFGFLVYGICAVDMAFYAAEEGAKIAVREAAEEGAKIAARELAAIMTELQKRREREYLLKFPKHGLN